MKGIDGKAKRASGSDSSMEDPMKAVTNGIHVSTWYRKGRRDNQQRAGCGKINVSNNGNNEKQHQRESGRKRNEKKASTI